MSDQNKENPPPFPTEKIIPQPKEPEKKDADRLKEITSFSYMLRHANEIPCFTKSMSFGGIGAALGGAINKYGRKASFVDGMFAGFLMVSTVTWLICRHNYQTLRDSTVKLIMSQSKPVDKETLKKSLMEAKELEQKEK